MEANICYKVKRQNYQGNSGAIAGIIIKGAGISIDVLGSETRPALITDMVDIAGGTTLTDTGAHTFEILPQYIYFDGTADSIELINYEVVETLGSF
jgi:hypothetical protein